ncbi:endonuclease domain-containing protein [Nocardia sp. NPDC060256]|uniref:endonuclease domain-containing protein n=1 Tax=unclassified Nocardia TaxID=2637762 RepID=UPI00364D0CC6
MLRGRRIPGDYTCSDRVRPRPTVAPRPGRTNPGRIVRSYRTGSPRPTTQLVVRDRAGGFVARVDMGWETWRVAVEYDGAHHWTDPTQRTKDIDRIATLESLGWRVIRVNATLLHHRPHVILDRVRAALHAHGWTNDQEELVLASAERPTTPFPPDLLSSSAIRGFCRTPRSPLR